MHFITFFISGLIGTAAMTAFVYGVAGVYHQRFQVIHILGTMLTHEASPQHRLSRSRRAVITGTLVHYLIGIGFAATYEWLWVERLLAASFQNALLLGIISGLLAVAVWTGFLKLHSNPPSVPLRGYLCLIFVGHIVFASTVTLVHQWFLLL